MLHFHVNLIYIGYVTFNSVPFYWTRFNDISVAIRTKCVQYSMHFLLNHPELRRDITETLKMRQHDSEENVRYEVVMAIVTTARRDFEVVSDSEDLLEFVKERTLDKKVNILTSLIVTTFLFFTLSIVCFFKP